MRNQATLGGRIGVLGVVGVVLVILKLAGVIDWSWCAVMAPFWAGYALILAALFVIFAIDVLRAVIRRKP